MSDTGHTTGTDRFTETLKDASVLVIDDEPGMRNFLKKTLAPVCARVEVAADTAEATKRLDERSFDVIVLDNVMPGKSGVDWLTEQQRIGLFSDSILMTAYADLDTAIAALRAGASDFLLKPFRSNQILNAIAQSLTRTRLRRQNSVLRHELEEGKDLLRHRDALLGSSEMIAEVRAAIERAATTDVHVVIRGEAGAGKQVAARMLHTTSMRADNPFVWLQCYGCDLKTFQARLFGQLAKATNGSGEDGLLLHASGGTLFLEDVGMLSPPCQNLLVELLTAGRYRPIGAARSLDLNVRIICSSTEPLQQAVDQNRFRADLFYLLNVGEIILPPLRERSEDIIEIAHFFAANLAARMGVPRPNLTATAKRRLLAHPWPGNVMELRNLVERALIDGDFEQALSGAEPVAQSESLAAMEQRHILNVLDSCGGNRAEAARRLGVARKTIDRKCQAWGI
ncbi:sigma-54 dependent transcriptional regulator [Gymnodinialimonas sp. 2305UL16-5]|uniref:sigma-54-dependent transcriptional regulator n=1 Tax=Gymnodinialimonas mytili TaxID=3126503 RepID=UPI00309659BE